MLTIIISVVLCIALIPIVAYFTLIWFFTDPDVPITHDPEPLYVKWIAGVCVLSVVVVGPFILAYDWLRERKGQAGA